MYWYDVDQFRLVYTGTFLTTMLLLSKSSAYICQVDACDTDNYCDDSVDDDQ